MIKLYQFSPALGLPNPSSFCLKLETYLRMTGLPYEVASTDSLNDAPKGKMPYIRDGDRLMADSNFIINYLEKNYDCSLDKSLSPTDKAISLAMRRLIEENLYWTIVYYRWFDDSNWPTIRKTFFGELPPIIRQVIPIIARRNIQANLQGHGMGRHTPEEIVQIGREDLTAIADFLADKPYLMGEKPTTVDASVYGLLANVVSVPLSSPFKDHADKYPNLAAYCQRIQEQYYQN